MHSDFDWIDCYNLSWIVGPMTELSLAICCILDYEFFSRNFDITAVLNKNQCRVEEITMKEDLIGSR